MLYNSIEQERIVIVSILSGQKVFLELISLIAAADFSISVYRDLFMAAVDAMEKNEAINGNLALVVLKQKHPGIKDPDDYINHLGDYKENATQTVIRCAEAMHERTYWKRLKSALIESMHVSMKNYQSNAKYLDPDEMDIDTMISDFWSLIKTVDFVYYTLYENSFVKEVVS